MGYFSCLPKDRLFQKLFSCWSHRLLKLFLLSCCVRQILLEMRATHEARLPHRHQACQFQPYHAHLL